MPASAPMGRRSTPSLSSYAPPDAPRFSARRRRGAHSDRRELLRMLAAPRPRDVVTVTRITGSRRSTFVTRPHGTRTRAKADPPIRPVPPGATADARNPCPPPGCSHGDEHVRLAGRPSPGWQEEVEYEFPQAETPTVAAAYHFT